MIRQKTLETSRSSLRPERTWEPPSLRFSPTAWAKLLFLRDFGDTEVGGFGISMADDLLYVENIELVRQVCTGVSVAFDDQAVADFFDRQVDQGRKPEQFGRVSAHTHPGNSPEPSVTDEETFARVFGRTEWAVMFILAHQGQSYARLRFHVGPGGDLDLPVRVDYSRPFAASDHAAWREEYLANVEIKQWPLVTRGHLLDAVAQDFGLSTLETDRFDPWGESLNVGPVGFCPRNDERVLFDDDCF